MLSLALKFLLHTNFKQCIKYSYRVSDMQLHQRGPEQVVFIQNKNILPDYQVTDKIIYFAFTLKMSPAIVIIFQ